MSPLWIVSGPSPVYYFNYCRLRPVATKQAVLCCVVKTGFSGLSSSLKPKAKRLTSMPQSLCHYHLVHIIDQWDSCWSWPLGPRKNSILFHTQQPQRASPCTSHQCNHSSWILSYYACSVCPIYRPLMELSSLYSTPMKVNWKSEISIEVCRFWDCPHSRSPCFLQPWFGSVTLTYL